MRIIAGDFKGKKILQPKDKLTRPLKDLTKEYIFNIITHSNLININLKKSNILDLFSGVGSFGLECISRGALSVTFFENYIGAIKVLKLNISSMNIQKKVKIIEENIFNEVGLELLSQKFQIIFIDPPFKEEKLNYLLEKIYKLKLLEKNGLLIIHRHKKEENQFPKEFKIIKEKIYGISKIIFLV
jgi:16S rRNA (guanine966-N2)-methyltransferase